MAALWSALDLESESYNSPLSRVFNLQKNYFMSLFIVISQATRSYDLFQ